MGGGEAHISEPSRGFGYAVERASGFHFARDTLHGTGAGAQVSGNRQHTLAGPQLALDSFLKLSRYPRPS